MNTLFYIAIGIVGGVGLTLLAIAWFMNGVDEIDDDATHGDTGGWKK
jgi:hypothetical protein